jgi:hypothetical protein
VMEVQLLSTEGEDVVSDVCPLGGYIWTSFLVNCSLVRGSGDSLFPGPLR